MVHQAIVIDQMVYDEQFKDIEERCLEWRKKKTDIYTMIQDINTGKIVGNINAMPLEDLVYSQIRNGNMIDTFLPVSYIREYDMPDYHLYVSSIAIHPIHRSMRIFRSLCDAFLMKIYRLTECEIYIDEISADAVSPEREKVCCHAGMSKLCGSNQGSSIYGTHPLPPAIRETSAACKNLSQKYREIYNFTKDWNYCDSGITTLSSSG